MNPRIVIVGVGALGSHVALLLRNVGQITIIDFDTIETKNVLSQMHAKTNLRKNKALAFQQTVNFLFGTKVDAIPHKLTKDNTTQLLKDATLVIDCVDNAEARTLIQTYVRAQKIACLHGALAPAATPFGLVQWDESFIIDSEAGMGGATCEDGAQLPFIVTVAGFIAQAAQTYLTSSKKHGFNVHQAGALRI